MSSTNVQITALRKDRGWSQEKLAAISGVSERTIQRIEKSGSCSLETKLALANAFDISPAELSQSVADESKDDAEYITHWSGAIGLFIMGLIMSAVILLTGTNGQWELASFSIVIGFTVILSIMVYGGRETYILFDNTSWIVRSPKHAPNLNKLISHANSVINSAYSVGLITSVVTAMTLAIHKPEILDSLKLFIPICLKPLIYAILFSECWFRPYKRKMESMLLESQSAP